MTQLIQILLIVLPVFLVIGLGFGLKRTNLVNDEFIFQLNRLVFYVALPALLFYKIGSADFRQSFNTALLLGLIGSTFFIFAASYFYAIVRKYPERRVGAFCQGAFRSNAAYIGIAVVYNAYGEAGLAVGGIVLGFLVPVLNFLAVLGLMLPQKKADHSITGAFWMYQVVFNPLILASFAGLVWSMLAIPMVPILDRTLSIVTGMALPLALLSIGASFSFGKFKGDMVVAGLATVVKIVIMPLITTLVLLVLGVRGQELGIGYIIAAAPTASAAFVMAQQLKSDADLTGSIIMVSTLASLFTYTVGLYLLSVLAL